MTLDVKKLKKLREVTGVSFSMCKKALEESGNDIEAAKKLLTTWGAEKVSSKMDRATSQGIVASYVHHNKKIAALIELLCETDFVSGNTEFQKLGTELAMQIASTKSESVDVLMTQVYIRDPSKKVSDLLHDAILKFGENIKVGRFTRFALGET